MTVSNIGLASVISDPFGKTASNIMKEVMKSNVIDDDKILKLVHRNCKNKDKILDSLHGYHIESDQRFKMEKSLDHMEYLDQLIDSYPQELFIEEYHVKKALEETQELYDWLLTLLQTEKRDSEDVDAQEESGEENYS